ncbi:MAG TPA: A/G-specific adenine glycosylase [Actinomycetota bacterium]|nr:A/G-specific adenine glycosylase [Actinomycetota bacterium]
MDARLALLAWYRPRARRYPWRRGRPDPYRVLVSEVMLQQTQVSRVAPAYRAFVRRFPTVRALARAPLREVLAAWSGLGHNRRALALARAARRLVADHGGAVPADPGVLATLPGIGPYTAAAVASIAYGVPVPALDTNAARVVTRARLGVEPEEAGSRAVREAAERWLHRADPGAWNQALMDLGREVCRPVPRCGGCPLAGTCRFHRRGRPTPRGLDGGGGTPREQRAFGAVEGRGHPHGRRGRGERFEGSLRQARGLVLRAALGSPKPLTAQRLAALTGLPAERVAEAALALARDGLVEVQEGTGPGRGRVRVGVPASPTSNP